jgi:hypothetical protein
MQTRKDSGEAMKSGCFWCGISFLLLCVSPFCFGPPCYGQAITIRIINAKNGQPLPKEHVSLSPLYSGSETKPAKYDAVQALDTDAAGVARFVLPKPAPEHLSVVVHMNSEHWHCVCDLPALVLTKELIEKGIVEGGDLSSPGKTKTAAPWEMIFVARPYTIFEILLAPLLRG